MYNLTFGHANYNIEMQMIKNEFGMNHQFYDALHPLTIPLRNSVMTLKYKLRMWEACTTTSN